MPKEELVEGIRQAVSKGEAIEKAMMSFYNSGYTKQDIEEAAAASQQGFFQQGSQQGKQTAQPGIMQPRPQVQPGVVQRVSSYGKKPERGSLTITIVLVVVLLLLLGALAAVILFKSEISSFFSGLVWAALS